MENSSAQAKKISLHPDHFERLSLAISNVGRVGKIIGQVLLESSVEKTLVIGEYLVR